MARIYAYMTGDRVTEESAANGDVAERGWVDERFSMRVFFESRNDVRALSSYWLPQYVDSGEIDTPAEWAKDVVESRFGTAYNDNGDGTIYSDGAVDTDIATGDSFAYAIHFEVMARHGEDLPSDDLLGGISYSIGRY